MKLYIDDVTIWELLGILIRLPKILLDVVREELFWWTKFYKYEISAGDLKKEHDGGLKESFRRMRRNRIKNKRHKNVRE